MTDVCVTVPKNLWSAWIAEGDAAGEAPTGEEWGFWTSGSGVPKIVPGERVYVVSHGRLRGYAPLIRAVVRDGRVVLVRGAKAVAVTIPKTIIGFRGWRYRFWGREEEIPFQAWKTEDVGSARRRPRTNRG